MSKICISIQNTSINVTPHSYKKTLKTISLPKQLKLVRISNLTVTKACVTNLFTAWNARECKQQKQQSCNPVLNF